MHHAECFTLCVVIYYDQIPYIDGQKVEKRLSSEVTKENNRIKSILKSYLSCSGDNVDYNSVINIDSSNKFWNDDANEDAAQHVIPVC